MPNENTRRRRKMEGTRGEEILEIIMAKNFPQLLTDTKPQIQESQTIQSRINTKVSAPGHIIFKLQNIKYKEKSLKEDRVKKKAF